MSNSIDGRHLRRIRKRQEALRAYASEIQDADEEMASKLDHAADDMDHLFRILKMACGRIEQLESTPGALPEAPLRQPSVLREVPPMMPPYQEMEDRETRLAESLEFIEQASEIRRVAGVGEYQVVRGKG